MKARPNDAPFLAADFTPVALADLETCSLNAGEHACAAQLRWRMKSP